jgi:hypothetical protein
MAWLPPNYEDVVFAELPSDEKSRSRSFYHPVLLGFHKKLPPRDFLLAEWDRIGILTDSPPPTDDKTIEDQVRATFPEIEPSDPRLVHEIRKLSKGSSHIHARCGSCRSWRRPSELLDVRTYPETAERPILDRRNREYITGPLVTVIDNELTERDLITGAVEGDEITKKVRQTYSRPKVLSYEAIDLKRGAGFVCSGCWTAWIRGRFKIDGVTYTRVHHITLLGAPRDTIDEHKARPGWDTPGMTPY